MTVEVCRTVSGEFADWADDVNIMSERALHSQEGGLAMHARMTDRDEKKPHLHETRLSALAGGAFSYN
jgi:hypothetical protein